MQAGKMLDIKREIREKLINHPKRRITDGVSGEAAVLISIVLRRNKPYFVLTRRTEAVATHKGQISFPGGMMEKGDGDLLFTALRETEEEIGVDSSKIEVLGDFHDYIAITDQLVRSFAGIIPDDSEFQTNENEVAYILEVPITFFYESTPVTKKREVRGVEHKVYYYDFKGEVIWGLTARIIRDFVDACKLGAHH